MPMASDELFLHALQAANRRRVGEMCKREPRADVKDCKWRLEGQARSDACSTALPCIDRAGPGIGRLAALGLSECCCRLAE